MTQVSLKKEIPGSLFPTRNNVCLNMNTKALVITDGQSTRVNELCFWDTDVGWGVGGIKVVLSLPSFLADFIPG